MRSPCIALGAELLQVLCTIIKLPYGTQGVTASHPRGAATDDGPGCDSLGRARLQRRRPQLHVPCKHCGTAYFARPARGSRGATCRCCDEPKCAGGRWAKKK